MLHRTVVFQPLSDYFSVEDCAHIAGVNSSLYKQVQGLYHQAVVTYPENGRVLFLSARRKELFGEIDLKEIGEDYRVSQAVFRAIVIVQKGEYDNQTFQFILSRFTAMMFLKSFKITHDFCRDYHREKLLLQV